MTNESTLRRIAYQAATESVLDMIRIEDQAAALARLRDSEKIVLPDQQLSKLAALDADEFAEAYDEVRTMYARSEKRPTISKSWFGGPDADFYTRVLEHAHEYGCSIDQAKQAMISGMPLSTERAETSDAEVGNIGADGLPTPGNRMPTERDNPFAMHAISADGPPTPAPKLHPMIDNPYWRAFQHKVAMNKR